MQAQVLVQRGDVDKEALSRDLRSSLQGTLEARELDGAVAYISRAGGGNLHEYGVSGGIVAALFYTHIDMALRNSGGRPKFTGNGGGIGNVGAGTIVGTLYTEDLDALVARTTKFTAGTVSVGGGYFYCGFMDSDGNTLGYVKAGAISIVSGWFYGKGSWSA